MLPLFCFAFWLESVIVPIQSNFRYTDDNGFLGFRSAVITIVVAFVYYIITLGANHFILSNSVSDKENFPLYITIYRHFNVGTACLSLLAITFISILQAILNFNIALEQLCIFIDELDRNSLSLQVEKYI